jgi:16S rRNA (guanine(1405)-N(7))-methyltransferase
MHESHIIMLLTADIKAKKDISGIDDSIVKSNLRDYFEKNKKSISCLAQYQIEKQLRKSAEYAKVLKTIRAKLHESYGLFQIPKNSEEIKKAFMKKLKQRSLTEEDYRKVLSLHLSTKERLDSYETVYSQIFKLTGKPSSIIDLGCGLNPLSAHYMNLKKFKYLASDIDKINLDFISEFFALSGIDGKTQVIDILNESDLQKLAFIESDVCFMFKILEIDKRVAEDLVTAVNSKFLVASFSTLSVSGKIMSSPERDWFEKMLNRLKLKFSTFKTENEIFYVIRKG